MNCKYCGNRVDPKWFSCKGCGAPIEPQEPITGRPYQRPDSWSDCSGYARNISPEQDWAYTTRKMSEIGIMSAQEVREELEHTEHPAPTMTIQEEFIGSATVVVTVFLLACVAGVFIVLFLL